MYDDPRYKPVTLALPHQMPAITRAEAERAARKLFRKFGGVIHGGPLMRRPARFERVFRCWISTKPTTGHQKGWGRLIHDIAHIIFDRRHPDMRPHHTLHATLERDIARHVAGEGWLTGSLRTVTPTVTRDEKRAKKLAAVQKRLKKWRTKHKRATTWVKKLERTEKRLTDGILHTDS